MDIAVFPFGVLAVEKDKIVDSFLPEEPVSSWINKEIDNKIKEFSEKYKGNLIQITSGLISKYGLKLKIFKKEKVEEYLNSFYVSLTKKLIKEKLTREEFLIQGVESTDELDKIINSVYERMFEWFGIYHPEPLPNVKSIEDFLTLIELKRKESFGVDAKEIDIKIISEGFKVIKDLIAYREKIAGYIEVLMDNFAPNLSSIATPLIGAKLISLARGLKNLAQMPSSKIQVLGAEKALFRYLKTGEKPPKHGVIVKHPLISKSKKENKGKVARTLASKIAICVKIDLYGTDKEYGKKVLKELEKKFGGKNE